MNSFTKKKILITGGTGYLGSNIINTLKDRFDFILLKRNRSNLSRIINTIPYLKVFNIEDLSVELIKSLDIDIILHCATHYGRKDENSVEIIEANLMLPLRLLSLCKEANKNIKFINTDTILDKNINVYSLSKSQFKDWMKFFSNEIGFINLQLEHFYGPRDDKTKFVSFLIDSFIKELPELDLTAGEQNRYFTYIDDVVSAFEIVINNIDDFTIGFTEFQVSTDEPVNLRLFICMAQKIACNNSTQLNFGAIPYRNGELMNFKVDCSAIKNLGWKTMTSLEQGLLKTIAIDKNKL